MLLLNSRSRRTLLGVVVSRNGLLRFAHDAIIGSNGDKLES
jgi:hypothetical protein